MRHFQIAVPTGHYLRCYVHLDEIHPNLRPTLCLSQPKKSIYFLLAFCKHILVLVLTARLILVVKIRHVMGGFLNCSRCVLSIFFVSRSVPDRFQIVPRLGGPLFQISRFLDFQKNLERGTGTPFQILATISRFPDCSRFWNRILKYVASTIIV